MRSESTGMTRRGLQTLFELGTPTSLTDGQLLEHFASRQNDQAERAFEALVERHGPMVLRVCRVILRDEHEAMDAFQATFLILARKGRGLWVGDSLGPWLHRVACRTASKARANASRRRRLERRLAEVSPASESPERHADLAAVLHEELDRLPERYRSAIVLCDLQGHSSEETARRLGCAIGTVGSRLSRGRERLRERLRRRGLAPTAGLVGMALTQEAIGASVPPPLAGITLRGVMTLMQSKAAAGASSATVALLAEDVSRSLLMSKIRTIAGVLAVACGVTLIAGGTIRVFARPQDPAPSKSEVQELAKLEARQKSPFDRRHEGYLMATVGNMKPLIKDEKGVRFQSREVLLYKDGTARIYHFNVPPTKQDEEPIVPPLRHEGPIREVCVPNCSDDSTLLLTTSDQSVKVWDALTGALRKTIEGQFARPLFFSRGSGGNRFVTIDVAGKVVTLWDAKTLESVATIRPEASPRLIGAGLSKDGKTLATIGEDQSVTLRDAAEGKPFATLRPPTPVVARVFIDAEAPALPKPVLQLDDPFWESVRFLLPPAK